MRYEGQKDIKCTKQTKKPGKCFKRKGKLSLIKLTPEEVNKLGEFKPLNITLIFQISTVDFELAFKSCMLCTNTVFKSLTPPQVTEKVYGVNHQEISVGLKLKLV